MRIITEIFHLIRTELLSYKSKITHEKITHPTVRQVYDVKSCHRRVSTIKKKDQEDESMEYLGRCELDSHADTTVAGNNCLIMKYTDRSCDVAPFSAKYTPMKDVPIVSAATGYTSTNGRNYILILNEAIYMGDMDHTLINPNQCRHHGVDIQDNPYDSGDPMTISTDDQQFTICLQSEGTVVYFDTWRPRRRDLEDYPHVELTY